MEDPYLCLDQICVSCHLCVCVSDVFKAHSLEGLLSLKFAVFSSLQNSNTIFLFTAAWICHCSILYGVSQISWQGVPWAWAIHPRLVLWLMGACVVGRQSLCTLSQACCKRFSLAWPRLVKC